jgi:hypothetical protein
MTNDERRTQIQLAVKKIVILRGLLAKAADEHRRDMEVSLCGGSYHDAAMSAGHRMGLIQAEQQIAAFHEWFLNQFEADL